MANVSGSRAVLAAPSHARAVRDDANAVADDGVLEVVRLRLRLRRCRRSVSGMVRVA